MGHTFSIGTPRNTSRAYNNPAVKYNQPTREKFITEDCNLLLILASYLNGQGASSLSRVASALNLESYKTSKLMYHRVSKDYVSKILRQEALAVVNEAMLEELQLSFHDQFPHRSDHWPKFKSVMLGESKDDETTADLVTNLTISADMGWQKRSSGNRYDSPSGHMFFIGACTGKIITYQVMCTACNICQNAAKRKTVPKPHDCVQNFDGHAKAMEAISASQMVIKIFETFRAKCRVTTIIADDDSSMRKYCRHKTKDKDGNLPNHVYEPIFLADLSHRCKVIAKPLYSLASSKKSISTLSTADANRLKVYIQCFFSINRDKGRSLEWYKRHVWCVVNHLFDDHTLCTPDFCWKKREAINNQSLIDGGTTDSNASPTTCGNVENLNPQTCTLITDTTNDTPRSKLHSLRNRKGYYHNLEKEKDLFHQVKGALQKYFTEEAITKVVHNYNTQKNEGLNTSVSIVSPKNKNYSKSTELCTRISLVAGIQNVGKYAFVKRLTEKFQLAREPTAFLNYLRTEDKAKEKKQKRKSMIGNKRKRVQKRTKKAYDNMRKAVKAEEDGATYGSNRYKKQPKESECRYRHLGCNTPGHKHKTHLSQECRYHYLFLQSKEDGDTFTNQQWLEKIRNVWEQENEANIFRNNLTTREILGTEFGDTAGDFSSNFYTSESSNASEGSDYGSDDSICRIISQESTFTPTETLMMSLDSFLHSNDEDEMPDDYELDDSGLDDSDEDDSDDDDSD